MAERLGRYLLDKKIGVGGMADVFLVHGLNGPCVVKRPHAQLCANPDFVRMFLDEASLLAQLNHRGIAKIFDLGHIDGVYYLAMEYVPGFDLMTISLEHERHGELMAPELCARIVADAADALHYAHEAKGRNGQPLHIVHRDVSPHNVLLSTDGVVKLIDFGVARASTATHRTQAGLVKGKYPYMSPEQITGQDIDRRVDVYALGLVLYELLTNVRAIAGDTEVQQIDNARAGRIRPIEQIRPNVPPMLRQIISGCLTVAVEERFASAAVVRDQLDAYLKAWRTPVGREDLLRLFRVVAADVAHLDPPPPAMLDDVEPLEERTRPTESVPQASSVALPEHDDAIGYEDTALGVAPTRESAKLKSPTFEQAEVTTDQDVKAVVRSKPGLATDSRRPSADDNPMGRAPSNPALIQPRPKHLGPPSGQQRRTEPMVDKPDDGARTALIGSKTAPSGPKPAPRPRVPTAPLPATEPPPPSEALTLPPTSSSHASEPPLDLRQTLPPDSPPFRADELLDPEPGPRESEAPLEVPRSKAPFIVLGLLVVGGALAVGLWWFQSRLPTVKVSGASDAAIDRVGAVLPLLDAGTSAVAEAVDAGATDGADAGPEVIAEAVDAGAPAVPLAAGGKGTTLTVTCEQPVTVFIDGQPAGKAPVTLELAAGAHTVKVVNKELGLSVVRKVTVKTGEKKTLSVAPAKGKVEIDVKPFARLKVDGKLIGEAVSFKELELWEGAHTLDFTLAEKNQTAQRKITVKAGAAQKVKVEFPLE